MRTMLAVAILGALALAACSSSGGTQDAFEATVDADAAVDNRIPDVPREVPADVAADDSLWPDFLFDLTDAVDADGKPDFDVFVWDYGTPDEATPDLTPPPTHIADIQQTPESLECQVPFATQLISIDLTVEHVVVTAPIYQIVTGPEKLDAFYVQDAGGGKFSGIQLTYPMGELPPMEPGMVLTIGGDHKEMFCFSVFAAKSIITEETGPALEPLAAFPEEIAADPEPYEGVLVRIDNVTVTNANPDEEEGLDNGEFVVNDVLRIGNDYALKYMNKQTDARTVGDVFIHITGVIKYHDKHFHLMPRYNSDLVMPGDIPDVPPETVEPTPDAVEVADVIETVDVVEQAETVEPADVAEDQDVPPVDAAEVTPDVQDALQDPADLPPDLPPDIPADPGLDIPSDPPSPLIITEIMYDPVSIPDDKGEWFEMYNASDEDVDLNGYHLESISKTGGAEGHTIMAGGPFPFPVDTYIVLGNSDTESENGGLEIAYQYPYVDFGLHNTTDTVMIRDEFGFILDEVTYDETAGWPKASGASIELLHPFLDNTNPDYWKIATAPYGDGSNKGTPGLPAQ